jgi:hypothetical protein
MPLLLPDIPDAGCTPLVRQLLDISYLQHERIQQLEKRARQLVRVVTIIDGLWFKISDGGCPVP